MAKEGTTMVLDVNLQCSKCYKKVKKLLCKYPEIRDQEYDVKANKVTIKVVCCSPEKIKDKLRCKGGRCIKNIVIKEKEKPKPPAKPKEEPKKEEKKEIQVTLPLGFYWGPYGYCGKPVCDCGGWGCYRCGCVSYCIEENPSLCKIM